MPSSDSAAIAVSRRISSLRSPVWLGLLGSLLILVGSYGAGYLAPGSALTQVPALLAWRASEFGLFSSVVFITVGGLLLLLAWLLMGHRLNGSGWGPAQRVRKVIALWTAPLVFALPVFSRDIFSYIAQGRLSALGLDPYTNGVSHVQGWYELGVDPLWAQTPTPYGPLFVGIERLVVSLTGPEPDVAGQIFRLFAIFGALLCVIYIPRIAAALGVNDTRALWISAASPLFIMNFIVAGHNDALMLGLLLAGIYYSVRRRPVIGVLLVAASIAIKPITILALPFLGLLWAGQHAGWWRTIKCWFYTAALSTAVLAALGLIVGVGFGWIHAVLGAPGNITSWFTPTNILGSIAGQWTEIVGISADVPRNFFRLLGTIVGAAIAFWLVFTRRPIAPVQRLAYALLAVVVLSPIVHPWYVLWVIALLAVIGIRDGVGWQLAIGAIFYYTYVGLVEPGQYFILTPNYELAPIIASAIAGIGVLALALWHYLVLNKPQRPKISKVERVCS